MHFNMQSFRWEDMDSLLKTLRKAWGAQAPSELARFLLIIAERTWYFCGKEASEQRSELSPEPLNAAESFAAGAASLLPSLVECVPGSHSVLRSVGPDQKLCPNPKLCETADT